jgi:hypothetical protein
MNNRGAVTQADVGVVLGWSQFFTEKEIVI